MIVHVVGCAASAPLDERELEVSCTIAHALLVQARVEPIGVGTIEAERRRREARELLMASVVPLAVFDGPAHAIQLVNGAWEALLGSATMPPDQMDVVFSTGATIHVPELAFPVEGGREVHCRIVLHPLRGSLGAIVGVIVVATNITDEVIARQLGLDDKALVWSGPTDRSPDYYNRRWRDYTGVTGRDAWQRVIHADDLPRCVLAIGEAARHRTSTDIEVRLRHAGNYCWHRVRFTIVSNAQRWFGSATNIHDVRSAAAERSELVSRERAARADAEQANRLKDQFLAAVSHELRTPLATMLLWEKVLRDDTADAELHAKALDAIHQSATAQSRLVGDLLDVARGISGKLFVDKRRTGIAGIVRDAVAAASTEATRKQIALADHIGPHVGDVMGDAHRLRQVFDNLISNAVKFTDPGGRVSVSIHRTERSVVVEVEDTGRGIAAEFLPQLFQPFRQTDDMLTRAEGGLGLGLSIAHQLVTLHDGSLVATSGGRGLGAKFTVVLPVAAPPLEVAPELDVATRAHVLDHVRVLLVDDDRRVRDALAILLGRAGAVVETADSAASARACFAHTVPDALVCDIAMPDEDGYSLVRTIRDGGASINSIPVIALTAHATPADSQRALESGFDLHFAKPIDLELLVASIHDLVVARRASAS